MEWLTAQELNEYLKISRATLNRMLHQGLPHVRVGRILRFDRQEVDGWLMSHRDKPHKQATSRPTKSRGRKR